MNGLSVIKAFTEKLVNNRYFKGESLSYEDEKAFIELSPYERDIMNGKASEHLQKWFSEIRELMGTDQFNCVFCNAKQKTTLLRVIIDTSEKNELTCDGCKTITKDLQ